MALIDGAGRRGEDRPRGAPSHAAVGGDGQECRDVERREPRPDRIGDPRPRGVGRDRVLVVGREPSRIRDQRGRRRPGQAVIGGGRHHDAGAAWLEGTHDERGEVHPAVGADGKPRVACGGVGAAGRCRDAARAARERGRRWPGPGAAAIQRRGRQDAAGTAVGTPVLLPGGNEDVRCRGIGREMGFGLRTAVRDVEAARQRAPAGERRRPADGNRCTGCRDRRRGRGHDTTGHRQHEPNGDRDAPCPGPTHAASLRAACAHHCGDPAERSVSGVCG